MFSQVCVKNSVQRGVSVPACITGHMNRGVSVKGGLCLGGFLSGVGSQSRGWSLSKGQYASYWNPFFFHM